MGRYNPCSHGPNEAMASIETRVAVLMVGGWPLLNRKRCSATLQEAIVTQGGCWGGAQNHGISSSMRFCGQPFTRRVRSSVKYACGLT
jgi:hypothetical protein